LHVSADAAAGIHLHQANIQEHGGILPLDSARDIDRSGDVAGLNDDGRVPGHDKLAGIDGRPAADGQGCTALNRQAGDLVGAGGPGGVRANDHIARGSLGECAGRRNEHSGNTDGGKQRKNAEGQGRSCFHGHPNGRYTPFWCN
jgi:hypothetical protein